MTTQRNTAPGAALVVLLGALLVAVGLAVAWAGPPLSGATLGAGLLVSLGVGLWIRLVRVRNKVSD